MSAPGRGRTIVQRVWSSAAVRVWPWTVLLLLLAVAAVFVAGGTGYVPDNRFEQFWSPGQRLARSFTMWDDTRGLGRIREDFWAGATVPIWLFRWAGASPAVAERLWHAVLLSTGGAGMVAVAQTLAPRLGRWAGIAGLLYAFGPYSAVFLTPSTLYAHYALAPWLVVAAQSGVRGSHPWFWAAVVALGVLAVGNTDSPGAIYAAVPAVLVLGHGLLITRTLRPRGAVGWLARTGVLCAATGAAALTKTMLASDAFAQRLASTEPFGVAGTASSWTETSRGLGFWVSYTRLGGRLARPEEQVLFDRPSAVVVTAIPALVALIALWRVRTRIRLLFGALFAAGALLMVGSFPQEDPSPWGRAWLWAGEMVPGFASFRSTYKAGSTMMIGLCGLFALGAAAFGSDARRRPTVAAGAVSVVVLAAFPFWTGSLHDPDDRIDGDVPAYWQDAMDWLDEQPGDRRVLVLPGSTRAVYRWGDPGDDVHDAFLERPHAADISIPLTTKVPADLLEAIDAAVVDGVYQQGSLAPVLRRIGVEFVMLRNDLDWARMGIARPSAFSSLRGDPDLVEAARFGDAGEHTTHAGALGTPAERALHPVEIFRLAEPPAGMARLAPMIGWTLVEGGGDSWFRLAEGGQLDGASPIAYAAAIDDDLLAAQLRRGGTLVVTDTNRRRYQALDVYSGVRSRILGETEDLGRVVPDLFATPGSQSVAVHAGTRVVTDPGESAAFADPRPHFRPAQALDGDLTTGWVVPPIPDVTTRAIRIEFREPVTVDGVSVVAFDPRQPDRAQSGESFSGVPRIGRAALQLSTGDRHVVNVITGAGQTSFEPVEVGWVELQILDTTASGPVGVAELELFGTPLDLTEVVRVPDSTFRRASVDPALASALASAAIEYRFERQVGQGPTPVEVNLRRQFVTAGHRSYRMVGRVRTSRHLGDECMDLGIRLDARPIPVRVEPGASDADGAIGVEACEPVVLAAGTHRIEGASAVELDALALTTGRRVDARADGDVAIVRRADSKRTYEVQVSDPAVLVSGDGFDDRWRAEIDGGAPARPVMVDAQVAWMLSAGREGEAIIVQTRFTPARVFRASLLITGLGVVVSVAIVLGSVLRRRS